MHSATRNDKLWQPEKLFIINIARGQEPIAKNSFQWSPFIVSLHRERSFVSKFTRRQGELDNTVGMSTQDCNLPVQALLRERKNNLEEMC